jgi:hypothetical protein
VAHDCFPRTVCPECSKPCVNQHGYHAHWAQKHLCDRGKRPEVMQRPLTGRQLLQACDAYAQHCATEETDRRARAKAWKTADRETVHRAKVLVQQQAQAAARGEEPNEPHWQTAVDALHAEIGRLEGIIIRQQREQADAQRTISALDAEVRVQRTRAENALADVTIWQRRMATWRPVPHLGTYLNRTKESA